MADQSSQAGGNVSPFKGVSGAAGASAASGGTSSGGAGGLPPDLGGLVLQIAEARISASEDRVMRQLSERTASIERELAEQLTGVNSRLDRIKEPPSIAQIAGVVAAGVGFLVGIAAFAYDRFDGGISASTIVDSAVSRVADRQGRVDAAQDEKLNMILMKLEDIRAEPQVIPDEGQN